MSPVSACHVFLFMRFCKYYIAVFRWLAMWGGLIISEAYTHSDIESVMASFLNLSWLKNSNAQIFKKCRCFSLVSCIERHTVDSICLLCLKKVEFKIECNKQKTS